MLVFYIDPPPEDESVAQTMTTSVTDSLLQIQETSQLTKTEPKKEHGVFDHFNGKNVFLMIFCSSTITDLNLFRNLESVPKIIFPKPQFCRFYFRIALEKISNGVFGS